MTHSKNEQKKLSLVIAAWNGSTALRECLTSVQSLFDKTDGEVIVVSNFESGMSKLGAEFPFTGCFVLPRDTSVPQLRSFGISRASGVIVALIEDFCTLDAGWEYEIRKAHTLPSAAVGGAVENAARKKTLDWAVYFFDYGKYMPPNPAGEAATLSGLNVSYKKKILEQISEEYECGFYETSVHEELKRRGHTLYLTPGAVVYHNKTYNFRKIVSLFYHQARSFAARRALTALPAKRLFLIVASPVLPVLLPARIVLRTGAKRRNLKKLLISLPHIMFLSSVWAFGEFCGYLAGEGKSGRRWK